MAQRSRSRLAQPPEGGRFTQRALSAGLASVVGAALLLLWSGGTTAPPPPQPTGADSSQPGVETLFRHTVPPRGSVKARVRLLEEKRRLTERLEEVNRALGVDERPPAGRADPPPTPAFSQPQSACVAWRQTRDCSSAGEREPHNDRPCMHIVTEGSSGYCECRGGRAVGHVDCSHGPFTCAAVCDGTAAPPPPPAPPPAPTIPVGAPRSGRAPKSHRPNVPPASPWRGSYADLVELAGLPPPSEPLPAVPDRAAWAAVSDATLTPPQTPTSALRDFATMTSKGTGGSAEDKRLAVVEALHHSWSSYRKLAWGRDELRPVSGRPHEWAAGSVGLSLIEALPTLWLAGLHEEFHRGREWVRDRMSVRPRGAVSPFEFTIRLVGGLLSAFEVSGERFPEFVAKAKDIADRLQFAFEEDGLPAALVDLNSGGRTRYWGWAPGSSLVTSEFTSLQLEFRTLSYHTKNPAYDMRATWAEDMAVAGLAPDKLAHAFFRRGDGYVTTSRISITAHGDSYYEYLIKQYLLTGHTEHSYKKLWESAADSMLRSVVVRYPEAGITTINEGFRDPFRLQSVRAGTDMDHLACFAGGMFALGALHVDGSPQRPEYMAAARNMTSACRAAYSAMPAGIAPEISSWSKGADGVSIRSKANHYNLRPEYAESLMYMWRTTKDPMYREWGWDMFLTLQKHCRTNLGYSGLKDVRTNPPQKDDWMPGFFFSETLKYLLLLFSDDSLVPLDRWVFNTEGHPLRMRTRNPTALWPAEAVKEREEQMGRSVRELSQLYRRNAAWVRRAGSGGKRH